MICSGIQDMPAVGPTIASHCMEQDSSDSQQTVERRSGCLGEYVFTDREGSVFLTAARAAAEEERANVENSSRARTLWRRPRRGSQRIEPPSFLPYCAARSLAGDQRAVLGGNNGVGS